MARIALLVGSGVFDAGAKNYKNYVEEFADFANKNKVDRVVISGGHTNPKVDDSEASSIKAYIAPRLNKKIKILTEGKSITASQSIKFAKPLVSIRPSDDVTVFCDASIAIKVMWFIMHYWFEMSRDQIERDALGFVTTHYTKKNGAESMGKWIGVTGVLYKNVEVHPCVINTNVHSAIAQQLVSLVDVAALYNPELQKSFVDATKERYGLKG